MTQAITHTFVSGVADGGDASLVRPSNWNATHTFSGLPTVLLTPTADEIIPAGYGSYVVDHYELSVGRQLELGAGAYFEIL